MDNYKKEIEVRWSDVDANGHLRHSAYADMATHSRVEWLSMHGFPAFKLAKLGLAVVIFSESTVYKKEVYLSEKISLDLVAAGFSEGCERWHFRQHFYKQNGELAAIYEVTGSWLDPVKRKLAVVPEEVKVLSHKLTRAEDYKDIELSNKNSEL